MKELTREDKIGFICKHEFEICLAISKGHKASDNDQFAEIRKIIYQYRVELGLIDPNKKIS